MHQNRTPAEQAHKKTWRKAKGDAGRAAVDAVTPELLAKGGLELATDSRMLKGSEERTVDSLHFRRMAPVKALERLTGVQGRRTETFLQDYHIQAANHYHTDLEARCKVGSGEIKEAVDCSPNPGKFEADLYDSRDRLGQIRLRLARDEMRVIDEIFRNKPDSPLTEIWENKDERARMCKKIKDALHNIAWFYGLVSHQMGRG